jgi:hypothetical protein
LGDVDEARRLFNDGAPRWKVDSIDCVTIMHVYHVLCEITKAREVYDIAVQYGFCNYRSHDYMIYIYTERGDDRSVKEVNGQWLAILKERRSSSSNP